jgi:hypothetical protein
MRERNKEDKIHKKLRNKDKKEKERTREGRI